MDAPARFFIGTYTRGTSRGIYASSLDTASGALAAPVLAAEAPNPTFLAASPARDVLYAVCSGDQWASSFAVDPASPALRPLRLARPGDGPTPCHISVDPAGTSAVAANYHLGLAAALDLGPGGAVGPAAVVTHTGRGPHPKRQDRAHVHSATVSPDGRHVLVCDLGLDRIYTYRLGRSPAALMPSAVPYTASAPGAGPRHLAFARGGRTVYVINELDNTITVFDYSEDDGRLFARQTVSVLPPGYSGDATAAEVRVHPGGHFLYGSSRGPDTLASFRIDPDTGMLAPVDIVPCGGRAPRAFTLSPDGRWLVCAHQDSDSLCSFAVDPATGRLRATGSTVHLSTPVCVLFA
jgi:6-phosphogluconolactonase